MSMNFGNFVHQLRGKETRKAVADRAGISAEYLRQIETYSRIPSEGKLIALAKALDQEPRGFLALALQEKNPKAADHLLVLKPRFPRTRKALAAKLEGPGAELVKEALEGLTLAPQERQALLLWAGVFFIDTQGVEAIEAREMAKVRLDEIEFVEPVLGDYIARHLVSWQVDPETGFQTHVAATARIEELLNRMAEHLGQGPVSAGNSILAMAREFAGLLKEQEFAALFHCLKNYQELSQQDKQDILALWELAGRLADERLERQQQKEDR